MSLREVIHASVESCRAALELKRHTFVMKLGEAQHHVQGDFSRLTQVFTNLLGNAVKYTERGGRIELRLSLEDETAVIVIADSGIGIPDQDLPRIFDLFWQVEGHRVHAQGGLGIGLALVRKLVELHHGTVTALSHGMGQGSSFTVRIPLAYKSNGAHSLRRTDAASSDRARESSRPGLQASD